MNAPTTAHPAVPVGRDRVDLLVAAFAEQVGSAGPVVAVGGRTASTVGGPVDPGTREVSAPTGILAIEVDELTVRVRSGTPVAELAAALAPVGQRVALPDRGSGSTVGGALAVGRSGIDALGVGPCRDAVLQIRYVDAWGRQVTAGGPTVKNVSGFDLCRLMVGSLGTLGLIAEVTLRTRPVPAVSRWFHGSADARRLWADLAARRPASFLWDGGSVWVRVDGHPSDVAGTAELLTRHGVATEVDAPPSMPPHRTSVPAAAVWLLPTPGQADEGWIAEVGVGIVHRRSRPEPVAPPAAQIALNRAVKERFDPDGRLAPGRSPWEHGAP